MEGVSDSDSRQNAGRKKRARRRRNPDDRQSSHPASNRGEDKIRQPPNEGDFVSERKDPKNRRSKKPGKVGCDKDKDEQNKDGSGNPPPGPGGPPAQKASGLWGSNNTYEPESQPNESDQSWGGARDNQRTHAPSETSYEQAPMYESTAIEVDRYVTQSTPAIAPQSAMESHAASWAYTPRSSQLPSMSDAAQEPSFTSNTASFATNLDCFTFDSDDD